MRKTFFRIYFARATLLILASLCVIPVYSPAFADDASVWKLRVKDGHPDNCKLSLAKLLQGNNRGPCIEADSSHDSGPWHSCVALPKDLLKKGEDYVVTVDYEVIDCSQPDCYFYVFARSERLGYDADKWQKWRGEKGASGQIKLVITPKSDDFQIVAGIHHQGIIRFTDMRVAVGDGLTRVPLSDSKNGPQSPPPPVGAKPFEIEPPINKTGPTLQLTDFGAVAESEAAGRTTDGDKNLEAFKAAVAKCREVKAARLEVAKGVYRINSGSTIIFDDLSNFIFDGGGSTFLFDQIKGGAGMRIDKCQRSVFRNFNMDWDWKKEPLASIGRITKVAPDGSSYDMHFESKITLDPKRWITISALDEKLRVPGVGLEFSPAPKKLHSLDAQTVRVFPAHKMDVPVGQLCRLRHYTYEKHCIMLTNNTQLSLQDVVIFSFPGIGFISGGDQHHLELRHCAITYPKDQSRAITTCADGFHVTQSKGFIKLEDCDFGYMGDDCVNIHDVVHSGVRRLDAHTLIAENIVGWKCPFATGDPVEIRNSNFSPTGFNSRLGDAHPGSQKNEIVLVFDNELPAKIDKDSILLNHRFNSHNCIIRNCYFHENRARGMLFYNAESTIEDNRFFHNQGNAIQLLATIDPSWSEGFGAKDLVIRNNKFESPCLGGRKGQAVWIAAVFNGFVSNYPLLENILFEGNQFDEMSGPAIDASSFKNLVIRNNTFLNMKKAPVLFTTRGAICAQNGKGLWLEGNKWQTAPNLPVPALLYDEQSTHGVVSEGNSLQ